MTVFVFSPVLFSLQPWRMICAYVEKLGSPKFRRRLADIAVAVLPDKNLMKLREIVNLFHETSQAILREKKTMVEYEGSIAQDEIGDGKDVMTLLRKSTTLSHSSWLSMYHSQGRTTRREAGQSARRRAHRTDVVR